MANSDHIPLIGIELNPMDVLGKWNGGALDRDRQVRFVESPLPEGIDISHVMIVGKAATSGVYDYQNEPDYSAVSKPYDWSKQDPSVAA